MQSLKHPQSPKRDARLREYNPIYERPETAPPQRTYFDIGNGRASASVPNTGTSDYFDFAPPRSNGPSFGHLSDYYHPPAWENIGYFDAQPTASPNGSSPAWEPLTPGNEPLPSPVTVAENDTARNRSAYSSAAPLKKISRPPNAWILYRSDKILEVKAHAEIRTPQAELSKLIAERWRNESPEVKQRYELQAKMRKQEHDSQNPGYKFKPQKKNDKSELIPLSAREKLRSSSRLRRAKSSTTISFKRCSPLAGTETPRSLPTAGVEGENTADNVREQFNAIWNTNAINNVQASPDTIALSPPDIPTPALSEDGPSLVGESWQPPFNQPSTSCVEPAYPFDMQHSPPIIAPNSHHDYALSDMQHDKYDSPDFAGNSLQLQVPSPESRQQYLHPFDRALNYPASAPSDASDYAFNMAPRAYDWPTQPYTGSTPQQVDYHLTQQYPTNVSRSPTGPALYQEMQEWVVQPVPFEEFSLDY